MLLRGWTHSSAECGAGQALLQDGVTLETIYAGLDEDSVIPRVDQEEALMRALVDAFRQWMQAGTFVRPPGEAQGQDHQAVLPVMAKEQERRELALAA